MTGILLKRISVVGSDQSGQDWQNAFQIFIRFNFTYLLAKNTGLERKVNQGKQKEQENLVINAERISKEKQLTMIRRINARKIKEKKR